MSSLARTIRRAAARRTGEKRTPRSYGVFITGSIEGFPRGAKCFDYENRLNSKVVVVNFRHPTKRRTSGRVCKAAYARKAAAKQTLLGRIAGVFA